MIILAAAAMTWYLTVWTDGAVYEDLMLFESRSACEATRDTLVQLGGKHLSECRLIR